MSILGLLEVIKGGEKIQITGKGNSFHFIGKDCVQR